MSGISKYFFVVLISLFCDFSYCNEPEDPKYISVLAKPSFSITSQDRQITLKGERSSFFKSSKFIIEIPNFNLNSNKSSVKINSKKAIYDRSIGFIKFKDSVRLHALNNRENLVISSEEISLNLINDKLSSEQDVLTNLNNLEIKSQGIEMTQEADNLNAEFSKGSFQINNEGSISKGYADKLFIISKENKIILKEGAILDQDGFIIKSDLIHYDYSINKILKSINSSIENNS